MRCPAMMTDTRDPQPGPVPTPAPVPAPAPAPAPAERDEDAAPVDPKRVEDEAATFGDFA